VKQIFLLSGSPREDLNIFERNTVYGLAIVPVTGKQENFKVTSRFECLCHF
jgi:hypothetical protein